MLFVEQYILRSCGGTVAIATLSEGDHISLQRTNSAFQHPLSHIIGIRKSMRLSPSDAPLLDATCVQKITGKFTENP